VTEYQIREAKTEDIDAILDLWHSLDRHTALPDTREIVQTYLDFAPDMMLVAEVGGAIVGTIMAGWDGWRGHMARLATEPSLRRSGIAKGLVAEAEARLKAKGARRIYALVDALSPQAAPFWQAMGYGENEHIVQYSKNLAE
jgi:ribosomal protein S18 acetylase RimI-like enzyme